MHRENAGGVVFAVEIHSAVAIIGGDETVPAAHFRGLPLVFSVNTASKSGIRREKSVIPLGFIIPQISTLEKRFFLLRFSILPCCGFSVDFEKSRYSIGRTEKNSGNHL